MILVPNTSLSLLYPQSLSCAFQIQGKRAFAIHDWYTKKQGLDFVFSKYLGACLPFKSMETFRNL